MQRKQLFYNKLIGLKQGNITIIRILRTEKRVGKIWECKCNCGSVFEASTSSLITRKIQNCPKCSREKSNERSRKQLTKHGKANTRIHSIWSEMISRCTYKGDTSYHYYGERGISICSEWINDFMIFYEWAIKNGYKDNLTIDRINTNGNYGPLNCRWVTMKEQCKNRRTTRLITVDGVTKTQNEWAELAGITHSSFSQARKKRKRYGTIYKNSFRKRELKKLKFIYWIREG